MIQKAKPKNADARGKMKPPASRSVELPWIGKRDTTVIHDAIGRVVRSAARIGKRGTIVIPAALRKRFLLVEGSYVTVEERGDGILLQPAAVVPVEIYTPERKAEFHLNNAMTSEGYAWARKEVRKMGLDPDKIPHDKPEGV